jgi:hypothetical protein
MFNKSKEDSIEISLERAVDRLDKRFMNSEMTQEQYDIELEALYDKADKDLDFYCWEE